MGHYTVDYTGLTPVEAHNRAIEDCKEYMGNQKFDEIVGYFRTGPQLTLEQFSCLIEIAGIRGYPAKAMFNYIWPL